MQEESNINSYAGMSDQDLVSRITELSDELRLLRHEASVRQTAMAKEAWENLKEAQATYRDVVGGSMHRTYIPTNSFGLVTNGRFRL